MQETQPGLNVVCMEGFEKEQISEFSKAWPVQWSSSWRTERAGDRHGKRGKYGRQRDEINPFGLIFSDEDSLGREYFSGRWYGILLLNRKQKSRPGLVNLKSRPGVQGIVPAGVNAVLVPTGCEFHGINPSTCTHFIVCKHGRGRSLMEVCVPASTYSTVRKKRREGEGVPSKHAAYDTDRSSYCDQHVYSTGTW